MVFTYWTGDGAGGRLFEAAWKGVCPAVRVYDDVDVMPVLLDLNPAYAALYARIRIAACKSDVARLAVLYEHGGLYVDAHGAPNNRGALERLREEIARYEVVIFDEPWNHREPGDLHVLTGALAARRKSAVIASLIAGVMRNLQRHADREAMSATRVDYNIFVLSGPWEIRSKLVTLSKPFALRPEFEGQVLIEALAVDPADRGFLWYVNYGYRRPGQHWSERQNTEPLFIPPHGQ